MDYNTIVHAHTCDEITNSLELKWKNVVFINDVVKCSADDFGIGYRIDAVVVDVRYQNSKELSELILKLMPNMTVDGFLKCNVFYCNDLNK